MPLASANGTTPTHESPLIFSQGDREIGRNGRFLGFTSFAGLFGATDTLGGRLMCMTQVAFGISEQVIAACIEVHRHLGPGLLESAYEAALCEELKLRDISFERQVALPVSYKGKPLDQTYRVDLIVAGQLLVEAKSVEALLPVHSAQVITYLRVTGLETGLLVNFNTMVLRHGLRRLSRTPPKNSRSSRSPDLCEKI